MNEFKKYALYFKGEVKCPFEPGTNEYYYWIQENFFSMADEDKYKYWIKFSKEHPDDFFAIQNLLNSNLVPEPNKGLLCYAIANWLNNSPQSDLEYWGDYGHGILNDIIYDGSIPENCTKFADLPETNKRIIKKNLIKENCRYYHGESACPFPEADICSTFWQIEFMWVNSLFFDDTIRREYLNEFLHAFPDGLSTITDKVPDSLKSLLYQQSGSNKPGFPSVLIQYIESALLVNS